MAHLYTDLNEIKLVLQLDPDDHSEDFTLGLYNEWTADIFEQVLDREIGYDIRTRVYPGTGTQKLRLRQRPVYPLAPPSKASNLPFTALSVVVDENAAYGYATGAFTNTPLVLGSDYTIRPDLDDGGSREAILYRINDYWPVPFVRQQGTLSPFIGPDLGSVQVTSTAGYTVDTLPASLRMCAEMIISRLRYIFPLGMQLTSESYIERSIGLSEDNRRYLLQMAKPFLLPWKNWSF